MKGLIEDKYKNMKVVKQCGFREGRTCMDNSFVLKTDHRKAFVSKTKNTFSIYSFGQNLWQCPTEITLKKN